MYLTNLLWEPYLIFTPWILKRKVLNAEKERNEATNYFSKNKFNKKDLANLKINKKGIFQDKVIPINKKIGTSLAEDKKLIDLYALLIISMWKQGFAEKVYKFVENYGIDSNNNVVLIDFAEIRFNKEDVKRDILSKRWKRVYSDKRKIKGELRKYYDKKLEEILTLKNLKVHWNSSKF